ncbi:hypothetical protein GCM10010433_47600 [Streptomyces pulveraceus]
MVSHAGGNEVRSSQIDREGCRRSGVYAGVRGDPAGGVQEPAGRDGVITDPGAREQLGQVLTLLTERSSEVERDGGWGQACPPDLGAGLGVRLNVTSERHA